MLPSLSFINRCFGYLASWLIAIMMLLTVAIVVLRYGFNFSSIALQEAASYCHASAFLLACAYTLRADEHVRVDIFYASMSPRQQAWVNSLGSLCLLLPFAVFCLYSGWQFFIAAWQIQESSSEPGGLPFVYLLKGLIPLAMLLLIIEACLLLWQHSRRLIMPSAKDAA